MFPILPPKKSISMLHFMILSSANPFNLDQYKILPFGKELIMQKILTQKTLWEKEKMLVTSIFSFSHNDFKKLSTGFVKRQDCVVWC